MYYKIAAEELRKHITTGENLESYESDCNAAIENDAKRYERIAERFEELKAYKMHDYAMCEHYKVNSIEDIYNKAIDDFVMNVQNALITDYSAFNTDDIKIFIDLIEKIAEQLKR